MVSNLLVTFFPIDFVCVYVYISMYVCIYIYIYIYNVCVFRA